MKFDVLIKNGKIVDGTGSPWYRGDIGIINGEIKKIGNLDKHETKETINAKGQIVCPGFIDTYTHFDIVPFEFGEFEDPLLGRRLNQGITTQITGCCESSMAPISKENKKEWVL